VSCMRDCDYPRGIYKCYSFDLVTLSLFGALEHSYGFQGIEKKHAPPRHGLGRKVSCMRDCDCPRGIYKCHKCCLVTLSLLGALEHSLGF
jgi:hypothetical protein